MDDYNDSFPEYENLLAENLLATEMLGKAVKIIDKAMERICIVSENEMNMLYQAEELIDLVQTGLSNR